MDTTQQYSNILKAIQRPEEKLTPTEKVENYDIFKKLNEQGIRLSDLLKKAEENETKADDSELFSLMESTVKNYPEIKTCRQHVADVKSQVLAKICYGYPEYKDAIDDYRRLVAETYKKHLNKPSEGKLIVSTVDISK